MKNRIILTSAVKIQCQLFLSVQQKLCCLYCQGEHFPRKCDKVTDVNARKEILKNSSCCYSCLKIGHASKKCTKNYFVEFVARNATLVFVRKSINNRLIKVQIQPLI